MAVTFWNSQSKGKWNEILNLKWKEPLRDTITANSSNGISKVWVRFSRSTGRQMEEGSTEPLVDYVRLSKERE